MSSKARRARRKLAKIAEAQKCNTQPKALTDKKSGRLSLNKKDIGGWFFAFATGAFSNHISNAPWIWRLIGLIICVPVVCFVWKKGRVWYLAATLACILFLVVGHKLANKEALRLEEAGVKFSIMPGVPGNPKNPQEARWKITNAGDFKIYEIYPSSIWMPFGSDLAVCYTGTNPIPCLSPGATFETSFWSFPPLLPAAENFHVLLSLDYKNEGSTKPKNKTFKFSVSKDISGNYQVLSYGSDLSRDVFLENPNSY